VLLLDRSMLPHEWGRRLGHWQRECGESIASGAFGKRVENPPKD
jgi:hypothetical protein